jgi:hypothetical protein
MPRGEPFTAARSAQTVTPYSGIATNLPLSELPSVPLEFDLLAAQPAFQQPKARGR